MTIKGPLISGTFIERPNRFITLVNINGKIVKKIDKKSFLNGVFKIDTRNLINGIYNCVIQTEDIIYHKNIVLVK